MQRRLKFEVLPAGMDGWARVGDWIRTLSRGPGAARLEFTQLGQVSSAADQTSFTERIVQEIEAVQSPGTQRVFRHAIYRIKRHALQLKSWWFKVCYGLKNVDSCRPTGAHDRPEAPPAGACTELVPGDYWEAFQRDCHGSLQSLSGISIGESYRLFASLVDLERCMVLAEQEGVVNPCRTDRVPVSADDDKNLWDYLDANVLVTQMYGGSQPRRHPERLRYAHLDLATRSKAGLAICHLVGQQLVHGLGKVVSPTVHTAWWWNMTAF